MIDKHWWLSTRLSAGWTAALLSSAAAMVKDRLNLTPEEEALIARYAL